MSVKSALRKLSRAFSTKDERAFDDAMEELEDKVKDEGEEPLEIHNHIPDMRDNRGEFPSLESSVSSPAFDGEMPPWFKEHKEATDAALKKMSDSFEDFIKKGKKEGEAEDHRRNNNDESEEEKERRERGEDGHHRDDEEENLEMDRRRNNDESESEEEKERRERGEDRRRNDDEANKEILGELEFEAPPGTGDRAYKGKGKDSAFLEEAFQDAVSKAEIIAPGIRLPTFDRKAEPVRTMRDMIKLRKTAVDLAYGTPATRGVIDAAMSGKTWDSKRSNAAVTRTLFNAVATQVGSDNNLRATDTCSDVGGRKANDNRYTPRVQTLSDMNTANREKAKAGWK